MDEPNDTLLYTFHRRWPFYFANTNRNISILFTWKQHMCICYKFALFYVNYKSENQQILFLRRWETLGMISMKWFRENPFYRKEIFMLLIITTRIWPCGQWCILHLGLWLTFWKDRLEVQLILENLTYIKGPTRALHALKMIKDSCNWDYILVWWIIIWKDAIFDLVVKNVSLYNPISKGDILRVLWGTFFVSNPLKWGMKGLDGFHMDWF